MAYGLGQKNCDMRECGVITSVLKEVLEKYFGGTMKSSKNWKAGVFWLALFGVSFRFRNTGSLYQSELDLLPYRGIQVHCRIGFQNTLHCC